MVRIQVFRTQSRGYTGFRCEGHAGYADAGEDIVCSAVSAVTIGCCNAIEKLAQDTVQTQTCDEDGILAVSFPHELSHDGELLMDAMVLTLTDIARDYSEYIEFHIEEV